MRRGARRTAFWRHFRGQKETRSLFFKVRRNIPDYVKCCALSSSKSSLFTIIHSSRRLLMELSDQKSLTFARFLRLPLLLGASFLFCSISRILSRGSSISLCGRLRRLDYRRGWRGADAGIYKLNVQKKNVKQSDDTNDAICCDDFRQLRKKHIKET